MKHQLYEGWIMARDELTPHQRRDLEAHLKECAECEALAEKNMMLDRLMASLPMTEPISGFTQRWKIRLMEKRMKGHRRQTSMIMVILSLGAIAVLLPLLLQTILLMISPEEFLFDLADVLINWLSFLSTIGEVVLSFVKTLFSTIPMMGWLAIVIVIAALFTGLAILWGYSLQRLGYLPNRERSL